MHKIPQAALRAKRNRASSTKCNWTSEAARDPGLHENWSDTLVLLKTTGLFQLMLLELKFHSKKFPYWTVLLENITRTFLFSATGKKNRNIRLAADATKEITDIISYTAVNRTSALRLGYFYAKLFRVRFPNSFSYMLEEYKISKVRHIFTTSAIK